MSLVSVPFIWQSISPHTDARCQQAFAALRTLPNIGWHQRWTACLPCKPMIWPSHITISAPCPHKRYIIANKRQQMTPSKRSPSKCTKGLSSRSKHRTGLNLKGEKKKKEPKQDKTWCWTSSRPLAGVLVVVAVHRPPAPGVHREETWEGPGHVDRCFQVRSAVKICL